MGGVVKMGQVNSIIRNVTIAPGYGTRAWLEPGDAAPRKLYPDTYAYDAIDISGDDILIDHVSAAYSTDETISANENASNVTIQYSNISQGQNFPQADAEATGVRYTGHALGSLLQAGTDAKISVHHNLYAQQKGRLPRVGSSVGTGAHNDFRNNVFYNWFNTAGTGGAGQPSFNKFVGNVFLAGSGGQDAVGGTSTDITTRAGGTGIFNGSDAALTRVYHAGNVKDVIKNSTFDPVATTNADFHTSLYVADSSFTVPYVGVTDTAAAAYERVLNYMGARWWERGGAIDTLDERLVNEVRSGTGTIKAWADDPYDSDPNEGVEWRAMLTVPTVTRAADWDTEASVGYGAGDGMPTWWEAAHGLNPAAHDHNGDFDGDGYTNVEEYLNEIAAWPAPRPIVFNAATNARFEQISNWDIRWQPSKYDEARIHSGAVTMNSPGQHAGVLKIAPNIGDNATLTISAGWIDVAQQLQVSNNGQVIVAGSGKLITPSVQLTGNAQLKLAPGADKTLKLASYTIAENAKLDVGDNKLVIQDANVTAVEQAVAAAYNFGAWDLPGILTTMPDAQQDKGITTLAVASADDVFYAGGTFGGVPVDTGDVLVMYTYAGDLNLDGRVDGADYGLIDNYVQFPGTTGYANGDINYDGVVDGADYGIIDNTVQLQGAPIPSGTYPALSASVSTVPEPSACGFAILAARALPRRRRRTCR
jgi:hypothetical protein